MSRNLWRVFCVVTLLCAIALLAGCGGTGAAPINGGGLGSVSVSITPASMTVPTGTIQAFTATVNNSGVQTVQWQVNGIPGGAPIIGTIDSSGNYTAPQYVPNPSGVVITAVANADNTVSGNARVNITGSLFPATVYLSPAGNAYVQTGQELTLSGAVTGPADTGLIWQVNGITNGNAKVGTITPGPNGTATYTAPAVLPNPATVTIQAVSHAESNRLTSCTVVLSNSTPTVATVTVTPVLAVVQASTSFTFTADVINAGADPSVTWQVNSVTGGTSGEIESAGTIGSESADQGIFNAPPNIPVINTVSIKAISNAQPTRSGAATTSISGGTALGVSVAVNGPNQIDVTGHANFTATVANANVDTVTWQVNGITGGNSTYGTITPDANVLNQGDYTAPNTAPNPPVVIIGAIPTADTKVAGTLPLTINTPKITASIGCIPIACMNGTEQLGIGQTQQFQLSVTGSSINTGTWYVCQTNSNPQNCILGGNSTLGTIAPDSKTDAPTYTAPATVPTNPTVIVKAIPDAAPNQFAVSTITLSSKQIITVQVVPPGPLQVQVNDLGGPFSANVIGSPDQNVSWYVNSILGGNSTVGTLVPDSNFPGEEDYIAPATIPNPSTVTVTAVPEADPTVVSNAVQITIIPVQQQIQVTISPNPPPPLEFGQSNPNFNAQVSNTANQNVDWTLAPGAGGVCGPDPNNPPNPCGTINPATTDGAFTTYTAPTNPPSSPYYVNITATSQADPNAQQTVSQEIEQDANAAIFINPANPAIQAGSGNDIPFTTTAINIPDFNTDNVTWSMSCDSLAPTGENCGPAFGKYKDGGGPGCVTYPGQILKPQCDESTWSIEGGQTVTYNPPGVLGSSYFAVPQCNTQPGQTDGFVAMTAQVNASNCQPQGTCEATVCINISPGAKK